MPKTFPDEEEYICEYCGHRQMGLSGSYLCPNCRHALSPASYVRRQKAKVRPIFIVLLFLVILLAAGYFLRPYLPKAESIQSVLQSKEDAAFRNAVSDSFVFQNTKTDLVKSQIDGKQYLYCDGEILSPKASFQTTLEFFIIQNGQVIYSDRMKIGLLTSLKAYSYHFEVDLNSIHDYDPGTPYTTRLHASGKSLSH